MKLIATACQSWYALSTYGNLRSVKLNLSTKGLISLYSSVVAAAVMERWFRDQISFNDPTERRINLSLLSFHPTSRSYLLKHLKDKTDTLKVQSEIANVLQLRAQAVLKTNRFDFMDEKSCSEILDATSELLKNKK